MQVQPNDLLRRARLSRLSPSGSGRPLSRQELADAVNAHVYATTGEVVSFDARHVGRLERGLTRWPHKHYRAALCDVLGAIRDADLGFYITRQSRAESGAMRPDRPDPASTTERAASSLLRSILVERHWQSYRTFRVQFLRAARELGSREDDPSLRMLDVSQRQFHRWTHGARPRPDSCRVLESMFGHPIARLLSPANPQAATAHAAMAGLTVMPPGEVGAGSPAPDASAAAVQVSVSAGAVVTVVCPSGVGGPVAVLAGSVRVLIEPSGLDPGGLAPPVVDAAPMSVGGARVYSLAQRRAC